MNNPITVSDGSNDRLYFLQTPQLVFALCRTPYDFTLWSVVKMIAGEQGECTLATSDLGALAMMCDGKVSDSRAYLVKIGLLTGSCYKDPGYPQPVWHLRVPDLWLANVQWRQVFVSLKDRIDQKKRLKEIFQQADILRQFDPEAFDELAEADFIHVRSLHNMKPSQYEEGVTYHEEGVPYHETKKNQKNIQKEEPGADSSNSSNGCSKNNSRNQKPTIDPVEHALQAAARGVSEATGPNPKDQWINYRDEALAIYDRLSGKWGDSKERETRRGLILGGVADRPDFDPVIWERAITQSMAHNVGSGNIDRYWKVYDCGGDYDAYLAKTYPKAASKGNDVSSEFIERDGEVVWRIGY
jgi:hypothetical protein